MGCQAVSDGRDSKTLKKDKQESFELSPNINRYKKAYRPCTIGLYHLDIMFKITQCFVSTVQVSFTKSLLTLKEPAKKTTVVC